MTKTDRRYTITIKPDDPCFGGHVAECGIDGGEPEHFSTGRTPHDAMINLALYLMRVEWDEAAREEHNDQD